MASLPLCERRGDRILSTTHSPFWEAATAAAALEEFLSVPVNAAAVDDEDDDDDEAAEEEEDGAEATSRCWLSLILCCSCCKLLDVLWPSVPSWLHMSSWQHITLVICAAFPLFLFTSWWLLSHLKLSLLPIREGIRRCNGQLILRGNYCNLQPADDNLPLNQHIRAPMAGGQRRSGSLQSLTKTAPIRVGTCCPAHVPVGDTRR